jgi:hypothetical protein
MDVFALNQAIHQYHHGLWRELSKRFVLGEPQWAVADAIRREILQDREAPPQILSCLGGLIECFRKTQAGN